MHALDGELPYYTNSVNSRIVIYLALIFYFMYLQALWHLWKAELYSIEALFLKDFSLSYCGLDSTSFVRHFGQRQLSAVLLSLRGTAHKAILLMNPGTTRCCDVVKANPNMQPIFEYFIHTEWSSFNQEASA